MQLALLAALPQCSRIPKLRASRLFFHLKLQKSASPYGGYPTLLCLGNPKRRPIAIQSRSNRGPTYSNRGIPGNRKLGWAGAHWWNSSNCGPIAEFGSETSVCSFQPLPAIRFGKPVWVCADEIIPEGTFARDRATCI